MFKFNCLKLYLAIATLSVVLQLGTAMAAVVTTGDVTPDNPATWTLSTHANIGRTGEGALKITSGGEVRARSSYIGLTSGSTGIVSVDGAGSLFENRFDLFVGNFGHGTLNITNGGIVRGSFSNIGYRADSTGIVTVNGINSAWFASSLNIGSSGNGTLNIMNEGWVTVEGETRIASQSGSSGAIHFTNGTLTTGGLVAGLDELIGTGTINTHGLVSDVDLVFDATHGLTQTFNINKNIDQNMTVNMDIDGSGPMGVGFYGNGSMRVADGVQLRSTHGYIGSEAGSVGTVTVDGADSSWEVWRTSYSYNNTNFYVGKKGIGKLNITNGGYVNNDRFASLGLESGSTGEVVVDGKGSKWTSLGLYVGNAGHGKLTISNGGTVQGHTAYVGNQSNSTGELIVSGQESILDLVQPENWYYNNKGFLYVGHEGDGKLTVNDGGQVHNTTAHVGSETGSTGQVTVDGAGSTWTNSGDLYLGLNGSGSMLDITNDGAVIVGGVTWLSPLSTSLQVVSGGGGLAPVPEDGQPSVAGSDRTSESVSNTIHFDQGTLTTRDFLGAVDDLTGTGTINTHGLVSDVDLVFDAVHSLKQTLVLNKNAEQNITINLNAADAKIMGAGYGSTGTMRIADGQIVMPDAGVIGYLEGSLGIVTVDGVGSTWMIGGSGATNFGDGVLSIGYSGDGKLAINRGGLVTSQNAAIGNMSDSSGEVLVDGIGSMWINDDWLFVGQKGNGRLMIVNGGIVSTSDSSISNTETTTSDVLVDGPASRWIVSGILRIQGYDKQNPPEMAPAPDGSDVNEKLPRFSSTLTITHGGTVLSTSSFIGSSDHLSGKMVVDGTGSKWINSGLLSIGENGVGQLVITNGGTVRCGQVDIYRNRWDEEGTGVIVDGAGSIWMVGGELVLGQYESGGGEGGGRAPIPYGDYSTASGSHIVTNMILKVTNSGVVQSGNSWIQGKSGLANEVSVDGDGSMWNIDGSLVVGQPVYQGRAPIPDDANAGDSATESNIDNLLMIIDNGLVTVDGQLTIHSDSAIHMGSDGMLALLGDADDSLADFFELIDGSEDAIRYWDGSILSWENIAVATYGQEYTLDYHADGDLAGYTVLTVMAIPEPATLILMGLGSLVALRRRR